VSHFAAGSVEFTCSSNKMAQISGFDLMRTWQTLFADNFLQQSEFAAWREVPWPVTGSTLRSQRHVAAATIHRRLAAESHHVARGHGSGPPRPARSQGLSSSPQPVSTPSRRVTLRQRPDWSWQFPAFHRVIFRVIHGYTRTPPDDRGRKYFLGGMRVGLW
jgi:hypothetical protein